MLKVNHYMPIPEEVVSSFYLEEYLSQLRIEGLTHNTIGYYIGMLHLFIRHSSFSSYLDFGNFVKLKMAYYNLSGKNMGNNTIYKHYKCIKKYSDFLKESELIDKVHINQIPKIKTTNPLPKAMTEEDILKMREYILRPGVHQTKFIQMRNYILVETFLHTGLRRAEIINLKRNGVYETHIIVEQGKGQKDRIIYIPQKFSRQLQEYIEIQDKNSIYVFCDLQGRQLGVSAISCLFRRIKEALKINLSPHLLRHTYASICVKRGINLYTLQQQMGHTSLKTTSIYLYLNSKETFEEMQKLRI
ncbi:MAG: site-specific integrase [Candidatus Gracilibacteria bacterium]|nr:site-specific integrase [Candidatus Gracilibacteria bacterium]